MMCLVNSKLSPSLFDLLRLREFDCVLGNTTCCCCCFKHLFKSNHCRLDNITTISSLDTITAPLSNNNNYTRLFANGDLSGHMPSRVSRRDLVRSAATSTSSESAASWHSSFTLSVRLGSDSSLGSGGLLG